MLLSNHFLAGVANVVVWLSAELLLFLGAFSRIVLRSYCSQLTLYCETGAISNKEQRHKWWFNCLYCLLGVFAKAVV